MLNGTLVISTRWTKYCFRKERQPNIAPALLFALAEYNPPTNNIWNIFKENIISKRCNIIFIIYIQSFWSLIWVILIFHSLVAFLILFFFYLTIFQKVQSHTYVHIYLYIFIYFAHLLVIELQQVSQIHYLGIFRNYIFFRPWPLSQALILSSYRVNWVICAIVSTFHLDYFDFSLNSASFPGRLKFINTS